MNHVPSYVPFLISCFSDFFNGASANSNYLDSSYLALLGCSIDKNTSTQILINNKLLLNRNTNLQLYQYQQ